MVKMSQFKKYYLYGLIGSLIAAAMVAVVTILMGNFNDTSGKVLGTLALIVFHSLVSLYLVKDEHSKIEKLTFFSDTLFVLLVSSLVTSLFAVWEIIGPETTSKIYALFFVIGFSALHSNTIFLIRNKDSLISKLVKVNQCIIASLAAMTIVAIFIENISDIYYRLLGSVAVIDITLTVVIVILYKLYLQKHPEEMNELVFDSKKGGGVFRVLLIIFLIYVIFQVLFSLLFFAFSNTNG